MQTRLPFRYGLCRAPPRPQDPSVRSKTVLYRHVATSASFPNVAPRCAPTRPAQGPCERRVRQVGDGAIRLSEKTGKFPAVMLKNRLSRGLGGARNVLTMRAACCSDAGTRQ